jgi:hypothetical protein
MKEKKGSAPPIYYAYKMYTYIYQPHYWAAPVLYAIRRSITP